MIKQASNVDMDTNKIKNLKKLWYFSQKNFKHTNLSFWLKNYLVPICNIIFLVVSSRGPMSCMEMSTSKPNKKYYDI